MSQDTGGDGSSSAETAAAPASIAELLGSQQLAAALDSMPDALIVLDPEGRIAHCNAACSEIFGAQAKRLVTGKPLATLVEELAATGRFYNDLPESIEIIRSKRRRRVPLDLPPTPGETAQQHTARRRLAIHALAPCDYEAVNARGRWIHVATRQIAGGGTTIVYRDVTPWKSRALQLEHTALHDPATGLPNRMLFIDRLNQELRSCGRERERSFGVALIDLDNFRIVNRSLGPEHGDAVLAAVARRVERAIRPADTLAHLEGDSFGCIIGGLRQHDEAMEFAQRIQHAFVEPIRFDGVEVMVSASIGIAFGDRSVTSSNDILRDAAIALDAAKRDHGNSSVAVFEQVMRSTSQTRFHLDAELRNAIRTRSLTVHYQPIVEVESLRLVGFEALARWFHPQLNEVQPNVFIRMAEDSGLIVPLGRLALDIAAGDLAQWLVHDPRLFVTVNISPRQFGENDLVADLRKAMERHHLPEDSLHLEITESTVVENPEQVAAAVGSIRDLGVRICIDDFGTGYSSLHLLQTMPYDVLKIDRSFVAGMADGRRNRIIMEVITELAHRMGMRVVAEGIERHDQLAMIRQIGCNFAQGFLFAPAMSGEDALKLVQAGRLDLG